MRKLLFLKITMSISILMSMGSFAQTPFSTTQNLDINYFNAAHMVHGDMWYDPSSRNPSCEYPKGTGKHASYANGLWFSAIDNSGNARAATTLFRTEGIDFVPGPLNNADTIDLLTSANWAKIWKINASTVEDFKLAYKMSGASGISLPKYDVIKEWPATGNIYAIGASGVSIPELLTATSIDDFAPFIDVNSDGKYNWKDGDYPKIKGDQMLWWVINDNGKVHTMSKSHALKLEVHISAYAYNRGSSVDRMLFYEYTVFNKSDENYTNFRMANFCDADLGYPFDDYLGIDSTFRMAVEFNASKDMPNGKNSYGDNPPITALSIAEMPGDFYPTTMQSIGSITSFQNSAGSPNRDPKITEEFVRYMNAKNADDLPLSLKWGPEVLFQNLSKTSDCDSFESYDRPQDRRFVLSSKGYNFNKDTKAKWGMIFMATDTNAHICPDLKLNEIKDLADTAWKVYWNPLPPLSTKELTAQQNSFKLYPNPAQTILYVQSMAKPHQDETIRVIDALGKTIALPITHRGNQYEINISALSTGVYSVLYYDGESLTAQRFVKE